MRTRTRLTTPPDQEPAPPPSTPGGATGEADLYVPGLALPTEPRPPSRYRRAIIVTITLVVLVIAGYSAFQLATAGQDFDPAVGDNPGAPRTESPDGGQGG